MSDTSDFVIGQKSMYGLEATVDYNNLTFSFLKRSLSVYAVDNFIIKPGKSKGIVLELKEIAFNLHGYIDFPEDEVATVAKVLCCGHEFSYDKAQLLKFTDLNLFRLSSMSCGEY